MTHSAVANLAHATAARLIARMGLPTDLDGVARTACGCDGIDPDGVEGQLYVDRMIGHFVNVGAGTAGY